MIDHPLAATYLGALERGDLSALLALFHPEAIVHSPLYGPVPAAEFYPRLLADTGRTKLHLRGVTQGENLVNIWFRFDWTLPSGVLADFECVDIFELDGRGLITALHIVYDTMTTRPAFERETGGSWRPATTPPAARTDRHAQRPALLSRPTSPGYPGRPSRR